MHRRGEGPLSAACVQGFARKALFHRFHVISVMPFTLIRYLPIPSVRDSAPRKREEPSWFLTESWGIVDRSDSDGGHSGSIDGSTERRASLKVVHEPFFCIHGHLVVHKSLGTGIYGHLPASQSFIHSNKAPLKPL